MLQKNVDVKLAPSIDRRFRGSTSDKVEIICSRGDLGSPNCRSGAVNLSNCMDELGPLRVVAHADA
jgi:hypothetical protein